MPKFKQLSDTDIIKGFLGKIPDDYYTKRNIGMIYDNYQKYLNDLPTIKPIITKTIDFHGHTVEESWRMFVETLSTNIKILNVITGASGILHKEFPQWLENPQISKRIISWQALNNGSFQLILRKSSHF